MQPMPAVRRRHFYQGSCSQAPETPNCAPAAEGPVRAGKRTPYGGHLCGKAGTSLPSESGDSQHDAAFSGPRARGADRWQLPGPASSGSAPPPAGGAHTPEDTGELCQGLHCAGDRVQSWILGVAGRGCQGDTPAVSYRLLI